LHDLRHAKVKDLQQEACVGCSMQKQVLELNVAMDNSEGMRGRQGRKQLPDDVNGFVSRKLTASPQFMSKGVTFEAFHYDERTTVLGKIEVEYLDDIGMDQSCKTLCLEPHAVSDCRIVSIATAQDLAHEVRAQQSVLDDMGRSHASFAQYR
jgi:hypothetical protein